MTRVRPLVTNFKMTVRAESDQFLSAKYKEIEEHNRMGKTRDLFKKIRNAKGTSQAKISTIKDRNSMDLT